MTAGEREERERERKKALVAGATFHVLKLLTCHSFRKQDRLCSALNKRKINEDKDRVADKPRPQQQAITANKCGSVQNRRWSDE